MSDFFAVAFPPKVRNGPWRIEVPDVPGFSAAFMSLDQALATGGLLLGRFIAEKFLAAGLPTPASSAYSKIVGEAVYTDAFSKGAVAIMLKAMPPAPLRERINIMIDPRLLKQADDYARACKISRSMLIEEALSGHLQGYLPEQASKRVQSER